MRTITLTHDIYTLGELTGINYRNALDTVARQRSEEWQEFESGELLESMQKAVEYFGMRLSSWSIGLFDRSHVTVDMSLFDDEQASHAAEWINDNTEAGAEGSCPFTGVYHDCYFFDYFQENGPATADTVKRDIVKAVTYMLSRSVNGAENSILDDEDNLEYADSQGLEFYEDGQIYYG